MPLQSIRLTAFRNLLDAGIDLDAPRVFFVGENGQGKTNLLEAIYYLSFASSFRGQVDGQIPRLGGSSFSVEGMVVSENHPLPERLSVRWADRRKEIRRSEKLIRDRKELITINPAIAFCHDDFNFASGEPERRRFFFDQTAGLVSGTYLDLLRDYRKILAQRNSCLREGNFDVLEVLDWQFAEKGRDLTRARAVLTGEFSGSFSSVFESVSLLGTRIEPVYRPAWKGELAESTDAVCRSLRDRRRDEAVMKTSLSGPHRDRWVFMGGGRDYASTASTGQLRLLSLALRTSQATYFSVKTGRLPMLLLDDVFLELDPARRGRFFAALPREAQAIFTFLPGEEWRSYLNDKALVYTVADGRFSDSHGE